MFLFDTDTISNIAAIAQVHELTLVTGNTRHFARIPGLKVENWFDPHYAPEKRCVRLQYPAKAGLPPLPCGLITSRQRSLPQPGDGSRMGEARTPPPSGGVRSGDYCRSPSWEANCGADRSTVAVAACSLFRRDISSHRPRAMTPTVKKIITTYSTAFEGCRRLWT